MSVDPVMPTTMMLFVLAIVFGFLDETFTGNRWSPALTVIVCLLFAGPQIARLLEALEGGSNWGSREAHDLAARIENAQVAGPLVGGGSTVESISVF